MKTTSAFRVLAVENDPVFQEYLAVWLESEGLPHTIVENGLEALRRLRSESYDLLLTDLIMPMIDGRQLCRIVKADPRWEDLFVVVVTGAASEFQDLPQEVPADVFIAKRPIQNMRPDLDWVLSTLRAGNAPGRKVLGTDQLHRRRITRELLEQNRNWERAYNELQEGVLGLSGEDYVVAMNPAAESLLGLSSQEALGLQLTELLPELSLSPDQETRQEHRGRRLAFTITPAEERYGSVRTLIVRDVTAEEEAQAALQRNLEDRELMLREVHHRLKNNLLMVASYVTLQIDDHSSDRERQVLQAIRSNLESIALVHERLYREDSLSSISFGDYLQDVVHAAVDVFGRSIAAHVALDRGDCPMEMNRALRLGLVVNEVVMNSLQHAFPDQKGSIRVTLDQTPAGRARIRIQDDGIGMSESHVNGDAGFGIQIIRAMVDQLGGEVSFASDGDSDGGTTVTIIFDCEENGA